MRLVDVRDDPLAVRLLPALDGLEPRVDLADRLVAEIEHVGVEERQVDVRDVRAGHVRPDRAAVGLRVILVLDPEAPTERRDREARDVAGGEDVFAPRDTAQLVDDDPVVDLEPGCRRQLGGGLDTEPGDDDVRFDRPAGAGRHPGRAGRCHRLFGEHLDAAPTVVLGHIGGQLGRQHA